MRQKFTPQMSLFAPMARNSIVKELQGMSGVLDANPGFLDLVYQDMIKTSRPDTGRQGLSAEQVLRSAVLKQYRQLTYEELAFHLEDSDAFRTFSR
ncbi:MAG: ISNCY family transposase, partial [Syntrophus sp. (in: bacteria)]|nr:ISNCY family transposase [Syntrophus sp. (in: bacteria)]